MQIEMSLRNAHSNGSRHSPPVNLDEVAREEAMQEEHEALGAIFPFKVVSWRSKNALPRSGAALQSMIFVKCFIHSFNNADEIARPLIEDDTTDHLDSTSDDVMHHVIGEPVPLHTIHEVSNAK